VGASFSYAESELATEEYEPDESLRLERVALAKGALVYW